MCVMKQYKSSAHYSCTLTLFPLSPSCTQACLCLCLCLPSAFALASCFLSLWQVGFSASSPQQYIPDLLMVLLVAFYIPFMLLDLIMQVRVCSHACAHAACSVALLCHLGWSVQKLDDGLLFLALPPHSLTRSHAPSLNRAPRSVPVPRHLPALPPTDSHSRSLTLTLPSCACRSCEQMPSVQDNQRMSMTGCLW